ncbi:hypothetical protein ACHWQZ_G013681 [Mnemiopsis leidyi]
MRNIRAGNHGNFQTTSNGVGKGRVKSKLTSCLPSAVYCKQCIESTHISSRHTTYRSPNGLQMPVCPVYECSRSHDLCRATTYSVLDTQHTLWACGTSTTQSADICDVIREYLPISRDCNTQEQRPEPRPDYYNRPTEEVVTSQPTSPPFLDSQLSGGRVELVFVQSGAEILERATEGETVIEQRDVLVRSGGIKVEGDTNLDTSRDTDQGSSLRKGRVEQIMQSAGKSHEEDNSTGGSVKNANFSPLIVLALLVQAVLLS